ncbi:MAG: DUF3667 domain-containing protein [Acidobacteriota bacterium]
MAHGKSTSRKMQLVTCKACGHRFRGQFCSRCGQKVITEDDKRLSRILGELLSALSFADSKLWRTFKTMVLRPGLFSRDFIDGCRTPYMKPLSVFLLANLIYFLTPALMTTFHTDLETQITKGFVHSPAAAAWVEGHLEQSGQSFEAYESRYNAKTKELSKLLLIVLALLFSVPLWLLHGPGSTYYAEAVVLSLEVTAFMTLFAIQGQGLLIVTLKKLGIDVPVSEMTLTGTALILALYALLQSERHFFDRRGWRAASLAFAGAVGYMASVLIYRAFLFYVTFWWLR